MANFRLGGALSAISEGLGLFAQNHIEEERRKADRAWQQTLDDVREKRAVARDTARATREDERFGIQQETQRQTAKLTAEHRASTLEQGDKQFDRKMAADERRAHDKRMEQLRDNYDADMEAAMGMDKDGSILGRYNQAKDEAVASFVARMAVTPDSFGEQGLPGFKNIDSQEALASKLIQNQMSPDAADLRSGEIWGSITGEHPIDTPIADNKPKPTQEPLITEPITDYQQPPPNTLRPAWGGPAQNPNNPSAVAAGGMPVDMVGNDGRIPPPGPGGDLFTTGGRWHPGPAVADWMQRPATEMFGKREQ